MIPKALVYLLRGKWGGLFRCHGTAHSGYVRVKGLVGAHLPPTNHSLPRDPRFQTTWGP